MFSLAPTDVAGKDHEGSCVLPSWMLEFVSVSDRLGSIYFTKWASLFCLKVAFWQDLVQG